MSSARPSGVSAIPFAFVLPATWTYSPAERELLDVARVRQAAGPAERDLVEERLLRVREPGCVPGEDDVVHEGRRVPERVGGEIAPVRVSTTRASPPVPPATKSRPRWSTFKPTDGVPGPSLKWSLRR